MQKGKIINSLIMAKAMARLNNASLPKDFMKEIPTMRKPRKKRALETKPRQHLEADFRNKVFKPFLLRNNLKFYRLENSVQHNNGVADFLVFGRQFWFVELKAEHGVLSKGKNGKGGQEEFRDHCLRCGVNYLVARNLKDLEGIIK